MSQRAFTKGYLIALKQDTWTINIQVVMSSDKNKIGMNANLGAVSDPDAITAAQWRNLLIIHGDIDPSSFYFAKDQKKLYLHRAIDNRAVTSALLRKDIENFAGNVRSTADAWNFTK